MNIGNTIARLRKQKGLKQSEFAKLVPISTTALSQIENNLSRPNVGTLIKICEILDITEPMLYLSSLDETDVPEERRDIFKQLYPSIKQLLNNVIGTE